MKKLKLFFSMLFFQCAISEAQLYYLNSTDGGSCYEVCYYNNYLFAGCANTLEVFDLTGANQTPGNLKFKKRFLSNIDNLIVKNGFLYVCANHDGLWKFDISNPDTLISVAHYIPSNIDESIYDIAFYGDSILVAAKTKIMVLLDGGNSFTYQGTVASFTGTTRIRGLDVKDSLLAYTVGYSALNSQDGIYLVNLKNMQQLDFYNDTEADPLEVFFGQNNKLLHIMGGVLTSFPFVDGVYYALDYTNPNSLSLQFKDTIKGYLILGSIATPMSAAIINDTIYIATQGGGPINYTFPNPFYGQVYVYDATNSSNINLLTDIYAGLYHFDIDINPATRKMYVASEWYGIITLDVNDIYNEIYLDKRMTGGWCHGSAFAKNKFVEAAEGYGIRLYDASVIQSPQLIAEDTAVGFCRAISISDSADFVYGWFLTGKRLRVRSGNDLSFVADTTVDPGTLIISDFEKSRYYNGTVAVIENIAPGNKKIVVADVSNPSNPFIKFYRSKNNIEDIFFHSSGLLFTCANDSIIIFNTSTMSIVTSLKPPSPGLQQFKAFTLSNDTLFVYYSGIGEGIAKYFYNSSLQTLTFISATSYNMNSSDRIFMATNDTVLYIASTIDSLKAIDKINFNDLVNYNHGADHIYDNFWGVTDLYYNNGHLFLNEYMGQTSIFGMLSDTSDTTDTTALRNVIQKTEKIFLYPNPGNNYLTIKIGTKNESLLKIFDAQGKLIFIADVNGEKYALDTSEFEDGIYLVNLVSEKESIVAKFIKQKK